MQIYVVFTCAFLCYCQSSSGFDEYSGNLSTSRWPNQGIQRVNNWVWTIRRHREENKEANTLLRTRTVSSRWPSRWETSPSGEEDNESHITLHSLNEDNHQYLWFNFTAWHRDYQLHISGLPFRSEYLYTPKIILVLTFSLGINSYVDFFCNLVMEYCKRSLRGMTADWELNYGKQRLRFHLPDVGVCPLLTCAHC